MNQDKEHYNVIWLLPNKRPDIILVLSRLHGKQLWCSEEL